MRITEARMLDLASASVSAARDKAAQAEQAMTSGNRVSLPSDDPAAWAEGQRAAIRGSMSEDRGQGIGLAISGLQQSDSALSTVSDALTKLGALATQAANGTLDASNRASVASEVRGLHDTVVAALDQKGVDGTYLFGGSKGTAAPFTASDAYVGDDSTRAVQSAEGKTLASSVSGSGATSANGGLDILAMMNQLATQLDSNDVAGVQASMPNFQTAIDQIGTMQSQVGQRLSALQSADDARQQFETTMATAHATAVEADPVAAASNLTRTSTVLQSAQAAAQQIVALLQR